MAVVTRQRLLRLLRYRSDLQAILLSLISNNKRRRNDSWLRSPRTWRFQSRVRAWIGRTYGLERARCSGLSRPERRDNDRQVKLSIAGTISATHCAGQQSPAQWRWVIAFAHWRWMVQKALPWSEW